MTVLDTLQSKLESAIDSGGNLELSHNLLKSFVDVSLLDNILPVFFTIQGANVAFDMDLQGVFVTGKVTYLAVENVSLS